MTDRFELPEDNGARRRIVLSSSWEELDDSMRLYVPDEDTRTQQYLSILQDIIRLGRAMGITINIGVSEELDLSDERISSELGLPPPR